MKVVKTVLDFLNEHISTMPPETGNILGSADGEIISEVILDVPQGTQYNCCYFPNVRFLNSCLEQCKVLNILKASDRMLSADELSAKTELHIDQVKCTLRYLKHQESLYNARKQLLQNDET